MHPILRYILAILLGIIAGMAVNMGIILVSSHIIPPPAGANLTTEAGIKAAMHLMEPKHFLMPFLAHAIGTFMGALLAVKIASIRQMRAALIIASIFLVGGILNVIALPAPLWFNVLDLLVAYLPMGWLAYKLGSK
jgi:hypothetical protein